MSKAEEWSLGQAAERCVTNNHFNHSTAAFLTMKQFFDCRERRQNRRGVIVQPNCIPKNWTSMDSCFRSTVALKRDTLRHASDSRPAATPIVHVHQISEFGLATVHVSLIVRDSEDKGPPVRHWAQSTAHVTLKWSVVLWLAAPVPC